MRSRLPLTLLAVCLCVMCDAQIHRYSLDFTVSKKNFADTVAIDFEGDQVYVPVTIDGQTRRFLLDTGSSQGVVYTNSRIGPLRRLGFITAHDALGRRDTVDVVGLPDFQLGSLVVKGYVATLVQRSVARTNYDGIIGFDLFNKGIGGKIDVQNRRLILTDRRQALRDEAGHELRYRLKMFVPYVEVSPFDGFSHEVLFDSGSRQLYAINKGELDANLYRAPGAAWQVEGRSRGQLAIGNFGAEAMGEVVFLGLRRLQWADFRLTDVHSLTTQGGSHVGAPLLRYGSLVVNPFRRRLVFQPYAEGDSAVVANKQVEIAYVPRGGRPAVGLVWEGGQAFRQGFRAGDLILKINGEAIDSFTAFLRYPFVSGQTYTYTVRDARGVTKEVRLTRE